MAVNLRICSHFFVGMLAGNPYRYSTIKPSGFLWNHFCLRKGELLFLQEIKTIITCQRSWLLTTSAVFEIP